MSIVFSFEEGYSVDGLWAGLVPGHVIGPASRARASVRGSGLVQIGAYCRAAYSSLLTGIPAARGNSQRIEVLETALLGRLVAAKIRIPSIDIAGIARWISAAGGRSRLGELAGAAGVSRQHLTREFHQAVGIGPKLYSRLARFRACLRYLQEANADWAGAAAECGYADQSHMIAEFREFSGQTPAQLASRRSFHPFPEADRTAR